MPTVRVKVHLTIIIFLFFTLTLNVRLLCDQPTAEEVLSQVRGIFEGIEDYTVEVIANVDMPGLRAPEMRAKLYYKSPDRIHVESTGFSILPREGIAPDPKKLEERYSSHLEGEQDFEGSSVYRLKLIPKKEYKRELVTILLVDRERFVVWRIQKLNEEAPFLTVDFEYELVGGRFFLPRESSAEIVLARMPGRESESYPPGRGVERFESLFSEEEKTPPKNGYVTIRFEGYRINVGLPDSLFEETGELKAPAKRGGK
jgi:outer membrane lipoprotein-sorting protein